MIQWCEDCKHFLWAIEDEPSREDMNYCRECLNESKPGEQAIRWGKREDTPEEYDETFGEAEKDG